MNGGVIDAMIRNAIYYNTIKTKKQALFENIFACLESEFGQDRLADQGLLQKIKFGVWGSVKIKNKRNVEKD